MAVVRNTRSVLSGHPLTLSCLHTASKVLSDPASSSRVISPPCSRPFIITKLRLNMSSTLSPSDPPALIRVLASSVAIADKAGDIVRWGLLPWGQQITPNYSPSIRNVFSAGKLGIVEKTGADDLQTQADRSAQVRQRRGSTCKCVFYWLDPRIVSWRPSTPSTPASGWWERRGSWALWTRTWWLGEESRRWYCVMILIMMLCNDNYNDTV